ncbi:dipeptidyl aminopeptidase/acylaminoacyl peptidase [Nitrobacteraceae bacterium AZCC 2146]
MSDTTTEELSFISGPGTKLSAKIYRPPAADDHKTGVVMCHGFGGIKEGVLPSLAKLLAEAGYTALTFDFRGFGASEGPQGRLVPDEQVEDTVTALEFLSQEGSVDPDRMGLYGTSFGGGIAALAAAFSDRPKALAVSVPVTSGSDWLRSMTRYAEFLELKSRALTAIRDKAATGKVDMGDRADIMIPDRLTAEIYTQKIPMAFETFYHVLNHEPIARAAEIRIPTLMFGVETDVLVPAHQTTRFYEKLVVEKELEMSPTGVHWSPYNELLPLVSSKTIAWYDRLLKPERR